MSPQRPVAGPPRERVSGTVYVHPPGLNSNWDLKHGSPLQSAWAVNETNLTNLFTGVVMNYRRFLTASGDYLLQHSCKLACCVSIPKECLCERANMPCIVC